MRRFEGKVAFVTGVARGQGRSHAVHFAQEGANIIGVDICAPVATADATQGTPEDLEETRRLIEEAGGSHHLAEVDVRDFGTMDQVVEEGVAQFGRLDVVAANAGINSVISTESMPEHVWQEMIDVNLTGVWNAARASIRHIRAGGRGGALVFTSSVCGLMSIPGLGHYSAAKHGVQGLAKTLAVELGPDMIRVNTVNPTNVDTLMVQNEIVWNLFMPELENPGRADAEKPGSPYYQVHTLPIPWVQASDISEAVLFLASDAARFITGVALPVDAGYMVKK